jgi:hypothetical protein
MTNFSVVPEGISVDLQQMPECLNALLEEVKRALSSLDSQEAISNRSKSFKESFKKAISKNDKLVVQKTSIFHNPRLSDSGAIFEIDAKSRCSETCGSFHLMNVIICLNNREAIGTNFLKLEVAAADAIRNSSDGKIYDENILGVLITFNKEVLRRGGWDPAYASAVEYTAAYRNAYRQFINSNIISLQLCLI